MAQDGNPEIKPQDELFIDLAFAGASLEDRRRVKALMGTDDGLTSTAGDPVVSKYRIPLKRSRIVNPPDGGYGGVITRCPRATLTRCAQLWIHSGCC